MGEYHINKLAYRGITEKRIPTSEEDGYYFSNLQDYLQIAFRRENVTHTHTHTHRGEHVTDTHTHTHTQSFPVYICLVFELPLPPFLLCCFLWS